LVVGELPGDAGVISLVSVASDQRRFWLLEVVDDMDASRALSTDDS
jgi:hypothetical protein